MHLVTVDRDFYAGRIEAMFLKLLVQRVDRRRLGFTGGEKSPQALLTKLDQSHERMLLTPAGRCWLG